MTRQIEYLEEFQIAIRYKHRCKANHRESVFVHEKSKAGETAWKGNVEVFDLLGHKRAEICYAWLHPIANGVKILTVLGNHLVDSAQKAVQAAIFVDAQLAFAPEIAV